MLWCPSCLTVLAREQTERDGTACERCGTRVTEKVMSSGSCASRPTPIACTTAWRIWIGRSAPSACSVSGSVGGDERHDPAARLADLAPALLGPADPDRALRRVRSGGGARRRAAGRAARRRRHPADGHRPVTAGRRRRVGADVMSELRRAGAPRDRRQRHVRRFGVVLPALPVDRLRRPSVGRRAHGHRVCRSTSTPAARSTCNATTCTPGS